MAATPMSSSSRCASPDPATRRAALLALLATMGAAAAGAVVATVATPAPGELRADLPGARLQGQGQMRFLGLHVYDIRWWTAAPVRAQDALQVDSALEIEYARRLDGNAIAQRSLTEMQRVGDMSPGDGERWLAAMTRLFPDVNPGDRITGVHLAGDGARFHVNGRWVGEIRDPRFARLFFGIWLSPRTSQSQLRLSLLGTGS